MGSLIGAMMTGGSSPTRERQKDDFYPTPPDVTEALLTAWAPPPKSCIWEPACGDGAISKVLMRHGYTVFSTDLNEHGYGGAGYDFLTCSRVGYVEMNWPTTHIITNPPFKLAAEFIEHACSMELEGVAMLLKSQFWHAKKRLPLFNRHQPSMVLPLLWRPDFLKQGGPTMDVMWCVWIRGWGIPTIYRPLPRPKGRVG